MKNNNTQQHFSLLRFLRHQFTVMAEELWVVYKKFPELLVFLIIALAIRVYQLPTHLIFFGDIGRDFLAAREMLGTGEIPLLGIPSSVPRFHQGPVSIWLIGLGLWFSDLDPVAVGILFVALQLLAMAIGYFIAATRSRWAGILFLMLFTFSPLAIAHARMPYHITPLPLALAIYLWALYRWWQGEKWGAFWSAVSFGFLFQFELAMAPLLLLIPWVAWQKKQLTQFKQFSLGLVLGFAPQLLYDLTHRFEHLGGFVIWIGYRLAAFFGYKGEHTVSIERLSNTAQSSLTYLQRIFAFDQPWVASVMLLILGLSLVAIWLARKKLLPTEQLTVLATVILTIAYLIHGSPSEAYFPPFLILLPALLAFGLSRVVKGKLQQLGVMAALLVLGLFNVFQINKQNWFVEPTASQFQYGQSLLEMEQVVNQIEEIQPEGEIALRSTDLDSHFASYLDGYRFLLVKDGRGTTASTRPFFIINRYVDEVEAYPGSYLIRFPSTTLIVIP